MASSNLEREVGVRFRDWACLHYTLLWAYEGPIQKHAVHQTVVDPDTSCWLINKGEVTVTTGKHKVTAKKGDWVFVASPKRQQDFSPDAEILSVHFHLTWPGGEQVVDRPKSLILRTERAPELEKVGKALVRRLAKFFPTAGAYLPTEICSLDSYLRVQNLLPQWIAEYLKALTLLDIHPRRLGEYDDRIRLAMSLIERHPLSEPFSETMILPRVGLNRSQFRALFLQYYGHSPKVHLDRIRLREAKQMLSHSNLSVKEIGFRLGFRHTSHFCLWYKKKTGVTCAADRE